MELERIAVPPRGPRELPLALLELGCTGRFELLTGPPGGAETPPHRATLPRGLPPFAPPLVAQLERGLLGTPEWLPPHQHEGARRSWQRAPDPRSLFSLPPTPVGGGLRAERDPRSGALRGFTEELLPHVGLSALSSPSLQRPPGPPPRHLGGSATNCPFWPGGLEEPTLQQIRAPQEEEEDVDFENDLLVTPPGLKRGVEYKPRAPTPWGPLSLSRLLETLDPLDLGEGGDTPPDPHPPEGGSNPPRGGRGSPPPPLRRADSMEELLKERQEPPPPPPGPPQPPPEEEWAEAIDASAPVPDFHQRVPDPACKWPFPLDPFQQQAVLCLERGHSLLVAAHTSAGKTLVAEYAIALAQRHMTRAIYTSPIKALSNQKFRDFKATFGDVGLLTGDTQLHPEASCLIMTTEILRSMLYNGSDTVRDLEWVVFDEVHYINDEERGVVWEEVLILLPEHVKLVLLSATVPNALEFAQWVGRTKRRRLRVLSTRQRPVPLEHRLYVGPGPPAPHSAAPPRPPAPHGAPQGPLFPLLDPQGTFSTQGYYAAVEAQKQRDRKLGGKQPGLGQEQALWRALLGLLRERGQLPVVAFAFSRSRCERAAAGLRPLQLVTPGERGRIRHLLRRWIGRLGEGDRQLPQVLQLSELLEGGVGVHHGGVLPLLKEATELLFSEGLVKVLFATETFAMGVNMPARTVVFDSIRKHDGGGFRDLLPGEYVQMSGRAGRRGLDTTGTVIILCRGAVPDLPDLHRVLMGRPTQLQSRFRLSYSMILNLLRARGLRVEDMMRRSYGEFPLRRQAQAQQKRVAELEAALAALGDPELGGTMADLPPYHRAVQELRQARALLMGRLAQSAGGLRVLVPGRVVVVCAPPHRNALGVILQVHAEGSSRTFTTLVLSEKLPEKGGEGGARETPPDPPPDAPYPEDLLLTRLFIPEGPCGHALEQLRAGDIGGVTGKTLRVNPEKLLQQLRPGPRSTPPGPELGATLQELARLAGGGAGGGRGAKGGGGGGVPLLDPLGVSPPLRDPESLEAAARLRGLGASLPTFRCVHCPRFPQQYAQFDARQRILDQLEQLQFLLSDRSLQLLPEYRQRLAVLQALGYVSPGGAVALGGRVAAALSCHELVLSELLLANALAPLRPEETVALLSCVVTPGRGEPPPPNLPRALQEGVERVRGVAQRVGQLQRDCGLSQSVQDFVEQLGFGLVPVVYEWARGMPFEALARLAPVQEGVVVRCIQRLEETCRELRQAARLVGDPGLAAKMEAASNMIKRDIVFAASLYTQ